MRGVAIGAAAALFLSLAAGPAPADPALDQMMQNMGPRQEHMPIYNAAACQEAEIGIRWVLLLDAGARATFDGALRGGKSALDSVIWAQHHNPHAQEMIRECPRSAAMVDSMIRHGTIQSGGGPANTPPVISGTPAPSGPNWPAVGQRVDGYTYVIDHNTNWHKLTVIITNRNPFPIMVTINPISCQFVFACNGITNPVNANSQSEVAWYNCEDGYTDCNLDPNPFAIRAQ